MALLSYQVMKGIIFFATIIFAQSLADSINSDVVLQLKDGALKMQNEMQSLIVKNLGYNILQDSLTEISRKPSRFDYSSTMDKFVEDLLRKTKIAKEVLSKLSAHIQNDYNVNGEDGEVRGVESCCNFDKSKLSFDSIFGESISLENICEQTPEANINICPSLGKSNSKSRLLKRSSLLSNLKDIYNSKAAGEGRYIYFGSLDGYTVTYPAYKDARDKCNCAQSDPRISSWMTEALPLSKGRNFVIVFDYSENIQVGSLLSLARKVGKSLLSMINSNDKILVKFYHNGELTEAGIEKCLQVLNKADPELKEKIMFAIDNQHTAGITASYSQIFENSFSVLERSTDDGNAKHFIFVTSGWYRDGTSEVEKSIQMLRKNIGCDVSMHLVLLRDTKDSSFPNTNYITNKELPGKSCPSQNQNFIEIKPNDEHFDIISKLSAIYSSINMSDYDVNIRYLMPHSDRLERGTTIDACQPIVNNKEGKNSNNVLIGVACISFLTSEFIREDWSNTEDSYWFLVKQNGQTMIHPKFGKPLGVDERSRTIHISNLESAVLFKDGSKLFRSYSGSEIHNVLKSVSRGLLGASLKSRRFRFSWKKVPDSSFILVIATVENYQNSQLSVVGLGGVERYHTLDLWDESIIHQGNLCADSKTQVAVKNLSIIKFPPDAFMRPSIYYKSETKAFVKRLAQLFTPGNEENNDVFKNLRHSTQATHHMDKVWINDKSDKSVNILSRYIAMENGFFRMVPATILSPFYDPRKRSWYGLMKSQAGMTLTTPYADASTREIVMTLGKVFYKGKTSKEKAGNIALDFTLQYFQVMLQRSLPCSGSNKDCVVIDRNGFVVYTKEFLDKSYNGAFENQHIIKMRKRVGKSLIQRRIMKKSFCAEFRNNQTIKEWFLSLDHVVKPVSVTEGCLQYNIVPIEKTNVLLLSIINACSNDANECTCSQPEDGERLGYCTSEVDTDNCECPCIQRVTCFSDFPISANTLKCTIEDKPIPAFSEIWYKGDVSKLPLCRDPGCNRFQASSECGRLGCKWCFQYPNKTFAPDNQRFCEYEVMECFPAPQISNLSTDDNKNALHLVPHGIGLIVVIIMCIVVTTGCIYYRHRRQVNLRRASVRSRSPLRASSSADTANANYALRLSTFIKTLPAALSSSARKKPKLPPSSTIDLPDLSTAYENQNYNADVFAC